MVETNRSYRVLWKINSNNNNTWDIFLLCNALEMRDGHVGSAAFLANLSNISYNN